MKANGNPGDNLSERRTKMKRIAIGLIVTGVVVSLFALGAVPYKKPLLGGVLSARADEGCSVATLEGAYVVTGRHDAPADDPQPAFPSVVAGLFTFDGNGNMTILQTRSDGGGHQTPNYRNDLHVGL